jgi:hypothetical protein
MSISVSEAIRPFRVVLLAVVIGVIGFFVGSWLHARYVVAPPVQPIAFSHRTHAENYEIPCMHCHVQAERSGVAGVPPVSTCMGCHQVIATDHPDVMRVAEHWRAQTPIPWIKVYDMPDFVRFTHDRHIQAGVTCQTCHGAVETMAVVGRAVQLDMATCVACHTVHEVEHGRDCWVCHK